MSNDKKEKEKRKCGGHWKLFCAMINPQVISWQRDKMVWAEEQRSVRSPACPEWCMEDSAARRRTEPGPPSSTSQRWQQVASASARQRMSHNIKDKRCDVRLYYPSASLSEITHTRNDGEETSDRLLKWNINGITLVRNCLLKFCWLRFFHTWPLTKRISQRPR